MKAHHVSFKKLAAFQF